MAIIVEPSPADTLREQHRRLWKRSRARATWMAANFALLIVAIAALGLGGLTVGTYLSDYGISESVLLWVFVGVLTGFGGPIAALKLWRHARPSFLDVLTVLVAAEVQRDHRDCAGLTSLERDTLEPISDELDDVERLVRQAIENANAAPLQLARERWRNGWQRRCSIAVRAHLPRRFESLQLVLDDGAQATPGDAAVFAETALVVAEEARDGLDRLLSGRPQSDGGFIWPEYWPSMRDVQTQRSRLAERAETGG